jgi:hypothetical protein
MPQVVHKEALELSRHNKPEMARSLPAWRVYRNLDDEECGAEYLREALKQILGAQSPRSHHPDRGTRNFADEHGALRRGWVVSGCGHGGELGAQNKVNAYSRMADLELVRTLGRRRWVDRAWLETIVPSATRSCWASAGFARRDFRDPEQARSILEARASWATASERAALDVVADLELDGGGCRVSRARRIRSSTRLAMDMAGCRSPCSRSQPEQERAAWSGNC